MELHVHGGPAVVRATLAALADLPDFRVALPGVVPPAIAPTLAQCSPNKQTVFVHAGVHADASLHIVGHELVRCPASAWPTECRTSSSSGLN